jgi:hypothetical protein
LYFRAIQWSRLLELIVAIGLVFLAAIAGTVTV